MAISLGVKIWGDIGPLLTELKKAEKSLNKFSRSGEKMGKDLTMGLSVPIVALGVVAVKNFGEAEKAASSLAAILRANGKDVQGTTTDYIKFATKIQDLTTVEDDAVIGLLQLAESMKAPDAKKAVQDAIGLSKAYGIELNAGVSMAVKAQYGQYQLLGRMLPAVKAAKTQTERQAIAEKILADSFTIATAQAKSGLGPLEQMTNQIGNMSEEFGKIIVGYITPFVAKLKEFLTWLNSLSEGTKKWVVNIAIAAAAIGPLILGVGMMTKVMAIAVGGLRTFITVMRGVGIFLAANPWLILAAAIALAGTALVAWNLARNTPMDDLAKREAKEKDQQKKDIDEYVQADKKGRESIIDGLRKQGNVYVDLYNKAKTANDTKGMEHYSLQVAKINVLVSDMKAAVTGVPQIKLDSGGKLEKDKGLIAELTDEIGKLEIQLIREVATNNANAQATANLIARKKGYIEYLKKEADLLARINTLQPKAPAGGVQVTSGGGTVENQMTPVSNPQTAPANKGGNMGQLSGELDSIGEALDKIQGEKLGNFFNSFKNAFSGIANIVKQAAEGFKQGWGSAVQAVGQLLSNITQGITDIMLQNINTQMQANDDYYEKEKANIEGSYMSQEQKTAALERLDKQHEKKRKELMREAAKDQKAASIIQAVIAGALAVVTALTAGPIAGEVLAVIVGALAAAQIALIASQPLPALAEGGLAFAPSMAVVGDNPNARIDPEVISPLSKLKGMMKGSQEVEVYGILKGSDIYISSERGGLKLARVRGY